MHETLEIIAVIALVVLGYFIYQKRKDEGKY